MCAARQFAKSQRPQGNSSEAEYFVSDAGEQPANLAVASFIQHDLQVGTLLLPTLDAHVRNFGEPVGKVNALPELAEDEPVPACPPHGRDKLSRFRNGDVSAYWRVRHRS